MVLTELQCFIRVFLVSLKKPVRESNLFTKSDLTTHHTVFLSKKDMFWPINFICGVCLFSLSSLACCWFVSSLCRDFSLFIDSFINHSEMLTKSIFSCCLKSQVVNKHLSKMYESRIQKFLHNFSLFFATFLSNIIDQCYFCVV